MSRRKPLGLFITGTDTGVGKTYVGALIARELVQAGLRVGVYKPAASGCVREKGELISEDAVTLWEAAGKPLSLEEVCPQRFEAPLAPHLAARLEGKAVNPELLREGLRPWLEWADVVLIEGAGGLMSPISDEDYVADLAYEFGYPLLVVSKNVLGTINHTLLTLIAATTFREGLDIAGIVLNEPSPRDPEDVSVESNLAELAARCIPPVLAQVKYGESRFEPQVEWSAIVQKARPKKLPDW
ncbi:dethiobiotin synthase [Thermogutta sp.]|uniref:dethiobiotin synthase n=1 Tax=Thermogutta sp. TaxID=1962930 RepID=UPI0032200205